MSDTPTTAKFPDLQPGKKPSGLGSVNGFGTTLIGNRGHDPETGTYVVTHVATALFIPIWAIAAYRVARAEHGGWYCLGRVPLSGIARGWNVLLLLLVLGGAGGIWWSIHTKSPEYMAGRKLDDADRAAAAGQSAQAARMYREVMDGPTTRADAARTKLAGLIENPTGPPSEAAGVYAVAMDLHRENRCPVPDPFEKGKGIAGRLAADDPTAALALLEVIAPYAPDPAAELAFRRELLEKLLAKSPGDPEIASRLAAVYEAAGEGEKCEKLLAPLEAKLGTHDGAAILGRIHAGRGQLDKAHALLAPYVAARLPELRVAQQDFPAQLNAAEERAFALLKSEKAPGFDYELLKKSSEAKRKEMISNYISEQIRTDPAVRVARQKLTAQREVVGAAIDLGLVQLQRGQAKSDPAGRKAELEAAEQTFLSISGVAGETDEYRLSLGRVYYWLGRPADGKKLFDELTAARGNSADVRLQIAHVLREVGETTEAKRLAEDVYTRETDTTKKQQAAAFRALLRTDTDDAIRWLSRSNPDAPPVQADLATERGHKAQQEGKNEEAADHFRRALEIYLKMPENAASFNNSALAHFDLYEVTDDREELTRGLDKLDRAIVLQPSDSILLFNGGSTATQAAIREVVGTGIDFRAARATAGWDALKYTYRTPAERAAVEARVAAHPGVVKARKYAEKVLVLAPKRHQSYELLAGLCENTHDLPGLKDVATKAEKAEVDLTDDEKKYQEFLSGASDAKTREDTRAAVTRAAAGLAAARPMGGRTFALAVGRYVRAKTDAWPLGEPADPDELVKLADDAHTAAPSAGTETALETALLFRAHLTLAKDDPGYAALAKKTQRSFGVSLVRYVLAAGGPHRDRAAANPDVRRLAGLAVESFGRDPDGASAADWVVVLAVLPDKAGSLGEKAKANPRREARTRLNRALEPYHAATALDQYWTLLLAGKPAEAKKVIADLGAKGVPVP